MTHLFPQWVIVEFIVTKINPGYSPSIRRCEPSTNHSYYHYEPTIRPRLTTGPPGFTREVSGAVGHWSGFQHQGTFPPSAAGSDTPGHHGAMENQGNDGLILRFLAVMMGNCSGISWMLLVDYSVVWLWFKYGLVAVIVNYSPFTIV